MKEDENIKGYWRFLWHRFSVPLMIVGALFLAFALWAWLLVDPTNRITELSSLSFWMSAVLAASTFTFTVYSTVKDWQGTFKKYMNVVFWLDERKVLELRNAPLSGEDDIRAYAQQIGMQANSVHDETDKDYATKKQRWLALYPMFDFSSELQPKSRKVEYNVNMYLRKIPERLAEIGAVDKDKGYLFWNVRDKNEVEFKRY